MYTSTTDSVTFWSPFSLNGAVPSWMDGYRYFGLGFSWGGFESLALPANPTSARTATAWQPSGPLIRYHIGLEDPDDLIADLDEGFERSDEHTSELQSLMRTSYAGFCLKTTNPHTHTTTQT